RAEDAGFTFALISDHFHPWIDKQGQSPFVWCVIGGIAEATEQLQLGTGVTCPTVRIHPAIIAHAAATAAAMMEGRFFLGVGTSPKKDTMKKFEAAGGRGKPRYGELTVCWAKDEKTARKTAHQIWPTAAMGSSLSWELALPKHFEEVAELVTEDAVAEQIICGPDPEKHIDAIREYADAGYDHVCVHQVGPDQEGFIRLDRK